MADTYLRKISQFSCLRPHLPRSANFWKRDFNIKEFLENYPTIIVEWRKSFDSLESLKHLFQHYVRIIFTTKPIVNKWNGENNEKCNQKNILILLFTIIQLSIVWAIAYYIYMYEPFLTFPRIVLFHDTRSNDSQFSDARFMHKLCFSLDGNTMTRVMRGHNLYLIEKLKDFTG